LERALDYAQNGDTIVVRPGRYDGPLTIAKDVEIVGDGDPSTIVIEAANASTITVAADRVLMTGLTVRQRGGTFPYQAVDIAAGRPTIESCVIRGGTRSSVRIRGTAAPTVRSCTIEHTADIGIDIGDDAEELLERNVIRMHPRHGIWIGGRAAPHVLGNHINDNLRHGVTVTDSARPFIEDNEIRHSGDNGIWVGDRAAPRVERNRTDLSSGAGLLIVDDAEVVANWNEVARSSTHNVVCESRQGSAFADNLIHDGTGCGVVLRGATHPDASRTGFDARERG
jgi:parallel beta-helix repeat protein